MASTGAFYFLENFGYTQTGDCLLYLNFKNNSNYPIYNIANRGNNILSSDVISGNLSNTGLFSHNGYFERNSDAGRILGIKTNTGDGWKSGFYASKSYNKEFSFIFTASGGKGVIFSNLMREENGGDILFKGFSFGINDANKLYFENRDDRSVSSYCLNAQLGENNSLMVSYSNGYLSLGKYDYFSNSANIENFFIDSRLVPESTDWTIGGISNNYSGMFHEKNYGNGYLEGFLFFNTYIDSTNFKYISSGFVCSPVYTGDFSGMASSVEITGYATGIVPISSGITGYNIVATGVRTDIFGNVFTGYSKQPLYQVLSGTSLIPLTGEVFYPIFLNESEELSFDNDFLSTFGMSKGVSIYKSNADYDVFSWNFDENLGISSGNQAVIVDRALNFDRVNEGFFIGEDRNFLFYLNGLFQNSGLASLTGAFYHPALRQDRDYYISGGFIFSIHKYDKKDYASVDFFNHDSVSIVDNFQHFAGTGDAFVCSGLNNMIFFNGQKLHTGNYYSDLYAQENQLKAVGNSIFFSECCDLFSGESGVLTVIKNNSQDFQELNSMTGFFSKNTDRFRGGSLNCHLNGLKMQKNKEFFEGCSSDLFYNFGNFDKDKGVLYNNNSNFFEN